ncbi:DNA annealing helicase and endonuclease ZRANB3 [Morella rubra]|uniref:DNA annealing helicase and endonuclease ZRANB3 n=1 Tax=Morella rubra TaxID=262757 RepID=A0A6A1V4J7_9ROSI|nr:DNA annealing helicase and endonuclease ZRANB3 [Morella rubra]KAB1206208.1 DNA annealing helicase and endonuclease ZRANB3 [Morella rubra]
MEWDDDEWDFSAEELDSLERDAIQKIAQLQRNNANSSSSCFSSSSTSLTCSYYSNVNEPSPPPPPPPPPPQQQQEQQQWSSPLKPTTGSSSNKAEALSPGSRVLPLSKSKVTTDEPSKDLLKISVKFFLHASGNIASKFSYDQVEKLDPLVHRAIAAASAVPDLQKLYDRMPSHIESKLLPFQRDGVRYVETTVICHASAIAVSACICDSWPVLILTPSSLRLHWASMIQQWLDIPPSEILVLLSQCVGSNRAGYTVVSSNTKGSIRLDGLFNIISYDIVPKLQHLLMASEFKVVIADESHFLKNAQAKRTTASLPVIKKAQYAILLSGTPALSRPIELFKQLEALYPDVYKNVHEYGNRYCKGGIFGVYQGASNHEELHNLMKATVMIRRLKKDVLSELPMKRRQQVFLDLTEKDLKQINALFRELEVVKGKIKACKSEEEVASLKFMQKNLISKIYTDSAEAKIPAVIDYLGTVIEAGCKFLIFAHHQSMIDAIYQFLIKKKVGCIRIDGSTPPASRQALVTDFQEKDAIKAAVLSIKAGGVGLTLTAASTVIFAELSWTPGDLIQAEDRAHRIGQASSVNVYYLLANDTVDDIIWDVVQSKLENLGQMLDGHEKTLEVSSSQQRSSPAKQKTLDSFIKRCTNTDDLEHQSKLKYPRH